MAKKSKPIEKRTYLKQTDVPGATLEEALRIPRAIFDHYAGKPTTPLYVAKALNIEPGGTQMKVLTGSSIAFGLTEGGAQADKISVTDIAKRVLRPTTEHSDFTARKEAVLKPRVFREFLEHYDGSSFPRHDLALNVLEEMGVPREKAAEVLTRIESSARDVGLLVDVKGKAHVSLEGASYSGESEPVVDEQADGDAEDVAVSLPAKGSVASGVVDEEKRRRVFITHGKNRALVDPIRKLLEYGELVPVVSVEKQSVSKPVPEKVMDDMRGCGAAIIHVDADMTIVDQEGKEHVLLNPNVLIEIGAAMAFYGRRFILLVREGVKLPSNLQGLYEVRYTADVLDSTSTIKLLDAIKDIKNYALPGEVK